MKHVFNLPVRIFVSIALVAFLLYHVDWNAFESMIIGANILLIILAGLLYIPSTIACTWRWQEALHALNIPLRFGHAFALYLEAGFYSNFLPTSFGGDAYKFVALQKKYSDAKSKILSSMLVERGSGFISLLIVHAILVIFFIEVICAHSALLLIETIITLLIVVIFSAIALRPFFGRLASRFIGRSSLGAKLFEFIDSLYALHNPALILRMAGYSILFIATVFLAHWLYFLALGVALSPLYIFYAVTVMSIAAILPISLNAIGVTEGLAVFMYGIMGVSLEAALSIALLSRVTHIVITALGGLGALAIRPHRPATGIPDTHLS